MIQIKDTPFDTPIEEVIYKTVGPRRLKLYVSLPQRSGVNRPAILFYHGGSFAKTGGSVEQFEHHAKHFAALGFVTMCVDCRNGSDPEFEPQQAIVDAREAFLWVSSHASQLGVDRARIIMCGASSGGYTVLCSLMIDLYCTDSVQQPRALVIFNAGVDGIEITNRLFPHLKHRAVAELSPLHNVRSGLPPMIWFVGKSDVIYEDDQRFCASWLAHGNVCEFVDYEDMEHGFFNYGRHGNVPFYDCVARMQRFLASLVDIGGFNNGEIQTH